MAEYKELSNDQIRSVVIEKLRRFPLFDELAGFIDVVKDENGIVDVSCREKRGKLGRITHFDLELQGESCHILEIGLEKLRRNKENTGRLYSTCEAIARSLGCEEITRVPCGHFPDGERIENYLEKIGYEELGREEFYGILVMAKTL